MKILKISFISAILSIFLAGCAAMDGTTRTNSPAQWSTTQVQTSVGRTGATATQASTSGPRRSGVVTSSPGRDADTGGDTWLFDMPSE